MANIGSAYFSQPEACSIRGVGADISNNTIHNVGTGMLIDGDKLDIKYNEIYNFTAYSTNSGAMKLRGGNINRHNKIHNNYIHGGIARVDKINNPNAGTNVDTGSISSQGIYLDAATSGVEIYENVISDVDRGIFSSYGSGNYIHDNTIYSKKKPIWINTPSRRSAIGKMLRHWAKRQ